MDDQTQRFELYRLYLATAERVSDRRAATNSWMLSVNSAIVALYGYLAIGDETVSTLEKSAWLLAIPASGVLVCLSWAALLSSFSQLNSAKFDVLQDIEKSLPYAPFTAEETLYRKLKRSNFSGLERKVPHAFIALYAVIVLAALARLFA